MIDVRAVAVRSLRFAQSTSGDDREIQHRANPGRCRINRTNRIDGGHCSSSADVEHLEISWREKDISILTFDVEQ
jgi:hypothetical protein